MTCVSGRQKVEALCSERVWAGPDFSRRDAESLIGKRGGFLRSSEIFWGP